MSGFDQYYDEAVEPGKRERAYAWANKVHNAAEMAIRICEEYGVKNVGAVAGLHRKSGKLDIGDGKLDIRTLSAPTKANVKKLYAEFGKTDYFKRSDALKVLTLTPTAISNLLAKMHQLGILEPVAGHGKGAWRFK